MSKASSYHLFSHGGLNILLDVPTGAVHLLDESALAVFPYFAQGLSWEDLTGVFSPGPLSVLRQAWDELLELVGQGVLFSPEPNFSARPGGGQLKALCLHVAHDCDLRCRYCFAATGSYGGYRSLMTFETGKAAVDMLFASGAIVYEIDFFGGEPLLNLTVVEEIAAYARKRAQALGKKVNLTLTTNGFAMDSSVRDRLVALDLAIILSHDGRERVHNANRPQPKGLPSYKQVMGNILELVPRLGENYYLRGTYTAHNLDFCEDIRHWLDLGLRRFSLEPVVLPAGNEMALTPNDLPLLQEQYWQLAEMAVAEPFTFFHFNLDWERGQCGARRAAGCGAGVEYLAVSADGTLYPCHQFVGEERWQMGDVHSGIKNNSLKDRFMGLGIETKAECRNCWARYHCGGGCHANAWWSNGDLKAPYELGCRLLKIRTEVAIYLKVRQALNQESIEGDFHGNEEYKKAQ